MHLVSDNVRELTRLSSKQHKALAALCEGKTVIDAASSASVTPRTVHRWLALDEDFRRAYKLERRIIIDTFVSAIQSKLMIAVRTLDKGMDGKANQNQIKAAQIVIENALKAMHFDAIELTELEELMPKIKQLLDNQEIQRQQGTRSSWAG